MAVGSTCPVCASDETSEFFEVSDVPVHIGIQWPDRQSAENCPKGDITLSFCHRCGFIGNEAFDPARTEYSQAYDNSLHFSPYFREYVTSLATRLIERYDLRDKDIIEIGCGKGDFLILLCELGDNRGVGFDPSYEQERTNPGRGQQVTFVKDFYSKAYANYQADLICCRYVFEHIHNPRGFLSMLRDAVMDHPDTVMFFEVPNALFILRELSIWDVIYEHCSYYTPATLERAFDLSGFDVCDLESTFQGQYLTIEARPSQKEPREQVADGIDVEGVYGYVRRFADRYASVTEEWKDHLKEIEQSGKRAVAWGAGAKGVSFLNALSTKNVVEYIVDINPHKQGKYVPGTGQRIVAPNFLRDYRPDTVILMNPAYREEIQQTVEQLGLTPEFMCIS